MQGQTGARDETYDVVSVLYHALKGADNCQKYMQDAQDDRMREFFQQAQQQQRQMAEQAKQCLQQMMQGQGSRAGGPGQDSAFSFGQQNETGSTGMGSREQEMSGGAAGGNFVPGGK
jgi:hypothetical protein